MRQVCVLRSEDSAEICGRFRMYAICPTPKGDIEHVALHRIVNDSAEATITSFITPRGGILYGTRFIVLDR